MYTLNIIPLYSSVLQGCIDRCTQWLLSLYTGLYCNSRNDKTAGGLGVISGFIQDLDTSVFWQRRNWFARGEKPDKNIREWTRYWGKTPQKNKCSFCSGWVTKQSVHQFYWDELMLLKCELMLSTKILNKSEFSHHFNSFSLHFNSINSSQQHWEAAPTAKRGVLNPLNH